MTAEKAPTLFIGSSFESLEWARSLQKALSYDCDAQVWTDGIFMEGGTALTSLLDAAKTFDFAAFVLTPDDQIVRRGEKGQAPRDNVVLELGMFVAALGPERVFVYRPRDQALVTPSDWWGILDSEFSTAGTNPIAAMSTASNQVRKRISALGIRAALPAKAAKASPAVDHAAELGIDLDAVSKAALAQGWEVQARDGSIFRLRTPDGNKLPFTLTDDALADRKRLRSDLVPDLIDRGLRVSQRVQAPVGADLTVWRPEVTARPTRRRGRKGRVPPK